MLTGCSDTTNKGPPPRPPPLLRQPPSLSPLVRLTEEMKNESSRMLFLLSTASDPSVPGNSPDGPGDEAAAQEAPQQVSEDFRLDSYGVSTYDIFSCMMLCLYM